MTKRTFVAIKIKAGNQLLDLYEEFKVNLQDENLKWVDMSSIHITLKFFGNTKTEQIEQLTKTMQPIAQSMQPFEFQLAKTGVFQNYRNPKVLWVGIENNSHLLNLQKKIENAVAEIGFPPEKRKFNPHLTLARVRTLKDRNFLRNLIEKHSDSVFQDIEVKKFHLFESELKPSGPVYSVLHTFSLDK